MNHHDVLVRKLLEQRQQQERIIWIISRRKHRTIQRNYNVVNQQVLFRQNQEMMEYLGEQLLVLVVFRRLILFSSFSFNRFWFQRFSSKITYACFSFIGRIDLWCCWFSTTIERKSYRKMKMIHCWIDPFFLGLSRVEYNDWKVNYVKNDKRKNS